MSYTIFTMRPVTEKVGEIKTNGALYSADGKLMGTVSVQGKIRDTKGMLLGRVSNDGKFSSDIFDSNKFKVSRKGHIIENGSPIGSVKQKDKGIPEKHAQWAACAFFFYETKTEEEFVKSVPEEAIEPPASAPLQAPTVFDMPDSTPVADLPAMELPLEEVELDIQESVSSTPIEQAEIKTVKMPSINSLKDYASMRMQAFMDKKRREKGVNPSPSSGD